ncbi:MAG: hypothetical protein CHACPFDD_00299 [Phycisphaerae bacterium]|nr:hypothetical protein [Phycisphaerae bacterium]
MTLGVCAQWLSLSCLSLPAMPLPESPFEPEAGRTIYRVCRVTAYCDNGVTASGKWTRVGHCAAPEDIPFGTEVYIPELDRTFIVTDRTAPRFRKNTVDIFMPTEFACTRFGCRYLECEFVIRPPSLARR